MTLDKLSIAWERLRSEPDAAAMVFGFAIMAGAGHLTTKCLPGLKPFLGKPNPDVTAFEALAFNTFAIQALYPPVDQYEKDYIDEGFRLGGVTCMEIATARLGEACKSVYFPRVFEYRKITQVNGMQGAVGHLAKTLVSVGNAKSPQLSYGTERGPFPGLEQQLATIGLLTFATTMPGGIAGDLDLYLRDTSFFE